MSTKYGLLILFAFLVFSQSNAFAQRRHDRDDRRKVVVIKKAPARGTRVVKITQPHIVVAHRGVNYQYVNGIFYQPYGAEYMVVSAPIGIRVRRLPTYYQSVFIGGRTFLYFNGIFYKKTAEEEYEVIEPPVGARVTELPQDAQTIVVNEQKLYVLDGVYYQEVFVNGTLFYEVVGKGQVELPQEQELAIGTQVTSLPQNSSVVVISGEKLYHSNGIYYKELVIGNELRYEVVGKN
ncbi:DUF6515 family protein [Pontibacter silvestris]|uniref:DUF6515 family protein n=1 Tax=Pontibacter silvestris TaxID=2305183 RepID=A0ABW4WXA2_9BACT|nr:DUF6515 family protein [Pontibacter silvestris]MCC9138985.1 DUF6515 family protein [Pontibacter silvestris]